MSTFLAFCEAELLQENYFHAVFESTKSVADRLRTMTGIHGDGARHAPSGQRPIPPLAFNRLRNETVELSVVFQLESCARIPAVPGGSARRLRP